MSESFTYEIPPFAQSGDLLGVVQDTADDVLEDIKEIWPVDTGESRAGWQVEMGSSSVTISNDVDYVPYINGGFDLAEAQFLFDANFGALSLDPTRATRESTVDLMKALKVPKLADVFNVPQLAQFRAGPKGAADLVKRDLLLRGIVL